MSVDMSTTLGPVTLPNPVMTASGSSFRISEASAPA
jgi:hypothetical protein